MVMVGVDAGHRNGSETLEIQEKSFTHHPHRTQILNYNIYYQNLCQMKLHINTNIFYNCCQTEIMLLVLDFFTFILTHHPQNEK